MAKILVIVWRFSFWQIIKKRKDGAGWGGEANERRPKKSSVAAESKQIKLSVAAIGAARRDCHGFKSCAATPALVAPPVATRVAEEDDQADECQRSKNKDKTGLDKRKCPLRFHLNSFPGFSPF